MEKIYLVKIGKAYVKNDPVEHIFQSIKPCVKSDVLFKDNCELTANITEACMSQNLPLSKAIAERFGGEVLEAKFCLVTESPKNTTEIH